MCSASLCWGKWSGLFRLFGLEGFQRGTRVAQLLNFSMHLQQIVQPHNICVEAAWLYTCEPTIHARVWPAQPVPAQPPLAPSPSMACSEHAPAQHSGGQATAEDAGDGRLRQACRLWRSWRGRPDIGAPARPACMAPGLARQGLPRFRHRMDGAKREMQGIACHCPGLCMCS